APDGAAFFVLSVKAMAAQRRRIAWRLLPERKKLLHVASVCYGKSCLNESTIQMETIAGLTLAGLCALVSL
ncbi:hypothetical protein, partial [Synechococcus sp. UW105]|uniref:hypothetical protein n=1 Tax=Synechococcus sp. UW105 TaxID=337067 RepID=UPI001A7E1BF1